MEESAARRRTLAPLAAGFRSALAAAALVAVVASATPRGAAAEEGYKPDMSSGAAPAPYDPKVFGPDPSYADKAYSADAQAKIYGGKHAIDDPRPAVEWGDRQYDVGPFNERLDLVGRKNLVIGNFMAFGDFRTGIAYNDNGRGGNAQWANRLNLDMDLKLTATERVHALFRPLDNGAKFTRCEFAGQLSDDKCHFEGRGTPRTLFFEGDLGAIASGLTDSYHSWDLPFAFGLTPLFFQNGIWMDDAGTGVSFAIPGLNSPMLDIANMDFTFFSVFDKVTSGAFKDTFGNLADHSVRLYGAAAFIEALSGYIELGAARAQGEGRLDQFSYWNLTGAYTRRYGGFLSNSVRVIGNVGQSPNPGVRDTADGFVVLVENSLITHLPLTLIPYANGWYGRHQPQSLARDGGAGGILKNTGINFETDGLTGFPKMDDSAFDTYGGALGLEYLFSLEQQLVLEYAELRTIGGLNKTGRPAKGDEHGLGLRYQRPLTLAWIARSDVIYADRQAEGNLFGIRFELRRKF